jgi:fructose-1,6-bisphosphatase
MTLPHTPKRSTLNWHLRTKAKVPDALRHLLVDISRAGRDIRYAIQTSAGDLSGGSNQFGEKQLKLDVLADELMEHYLRESGSVACYCSEEHDDIVEIDPSCPYSVVFDPLDGSSLVDANFAIGSIFGIYAGSTIIGKTPREQVAAGYILYGPRTLFVYSTGDGVHMFLLNDVGEFIVLREHLGIADKAKNFSPGNLSAIHDNPGYKKALDHWLTEMTLRYSGCMVADIHHILTKGQGIFTNVGGKKYPQGKLRMVFECGPFAYLVEQAGGASSDGSGSLLDKKITACDQRTPIIVGSSNEVVCALKLLNSSENTH